MLRGRAQRKASDLVQVDYRGVMGMIWESMPAADFVHMVSSQKFLGNLCIKTQHFIGASKYVQTGDQTIEGLHQMRVAHQKYESDNLDIVLYHGHAHGSATIRYACVEGVWKFAGLVPDIRWSEGEYSKMFRGD